MPVTIIRRMCLWSFRAFLFITAGELENAFILRGESEWKAGEGNMGFVGEMNFLSEKTDFGACDKFETKAFKTKQKKYVSLGQGFHVLISMISSSRSTIRYPSHQPQWTATPWGPYSLAMRYTAKASPLRTF